MVRDRNTLKGWFLRGMKPLASQFADWIDSFWHKNDSIPATSIDGLDGMINSKAEKILLEAETAARMAADSTLQSQINALPPPVQPVQPDWEQDDEESEDFIRNKPDLSIKYADITLDTPAATFPLNFYGSQSDVLAVQLAGNYMNVSVNIPSIRSEIPDGKALLTRFAILPGQTLTLTLGFPNKLIEDAALTLHGEGTYVMTTVKMTEYATVNIAKYE
jgi:hypothetical protein